VVTPLALPRRWCECGLFGATAHFSGDFVRREFESPCSLMSTRRIHVQMTFEDRRKLTLAGRKKKRPGPKPAEFANVRHRARGVHKYWNPLHVTMRAKRGLPSFRAQTLFVAFERAVRRTRRDDFRVVEFSVQDDHLHLIVEADDSDALARGMKSFSVRANRLFNAACGRGRGQVWGDR
jgi:REP element-mobilizing transposase RayT